MAALSDEDDGTVGRMAVSETLVLEAVLGDCANVDSELLGALVALSLELESPFELEATIGMRVVDTELLVSARVGIGLSVVVKYAAGELEATDELLPAGGLKREVTVEIPSADGAVDKVTANSAADPTVEAARVVVGSMLLAAEGEPASEVEATDDEVRVVSEAVLSTGIMEYVTTTVVDAAEVDSIDDKVHDVSEGSLSAGMTEFVATTVVGISEVDATHNVVNDVSEASLSTGTTEAVITSVVVMSDDAELAASLTLDGKNEENGM